MRPASILSGGKTEVARREAWRLQMPQQKTEGRTVKYKTPLEAAAALRLAADWLTSPGKVRIRGRRLRRIVGHIVHHERPAEVCLLGAAWFALEGEIESDNTTMAIRRLAVGKRGVAADLVQAYQSFDEGMEYGARSSDGRRALQDALDAINRAATKLEAEALKTTAREPEAPLTVEDVMSGKNKVFNA